MTPHDLLALARAATAGPWRQGAVTGRCEKPSHKPNGHPGPRGDDPCDYTYRIVANNEIERCFVSIDPNITLIGSDDNGPILSEKNAAYIAAASPDVVAGLCERVAALEAKIASVTAIDDLVVDDLVKSSNAATARVHAQAARIAELEADARKDVNALDGVAAELARAIARIAELERGLREACKMLEQSLGRGPGFEEDWERIRELQALAEDKP